MQLNYEEFMSLIPEETKKYVKIVLKYLNYYIIEENEIDSPKWDEYFANRYDNLGNQSLEKAKFLLSTLLGLLHGGDTASLVKRHRFSFDKVSIDAPIDKIEYNEESVFNRCYGIFCFFNDKTKYSTLLASDIASNMMSKVSSNIKSNVFSYFDVDSGIENIITKTALNEHNQINSKYEQELYMSLPYHTINYINIASSIRSILISKISNGDIKENEYIKNDDTYLVPISLLLAIYEYDGSDKNALKSYLIAQGLNLSAIYEKFIRCSLSSNIQSEPKNMESVKMLYKRYWTEGVNKDRKDNVKIVDVAVNLFDRSFTNSIVIDRYLDIAKKTTDDFKDMPDKVNAIEKIFKTSKIDTEVNHFYSNISKDTKEFIIFTSKVYQTLLKKKKENKYNQEFLREDNDFVTLAIYIASHFYNADLEEFFNYHNVTFDKVMALVNITITREEIEKETLDKAILLEKFKKFIYDGKNNNKNKENVSINDVSLNICHRSFTSSMIIENLFEELRRDINLPSDFYDMVNKVLEKKKKEFEKQEKEAFFKDLPIEDLEYLTNVCHSYNYLSINYSNKYNDELLVILALLIGLNKLDNNKIKDLFVGLGIDSNAIINYFSINVYDSGDLNIELLKTKFYKYIFEGRNKDNKSPTIQDIAFNIFNEELYVNIKIKEFLNKLGLSYDSFKNPKLLIENYEEKIRKEQAIKEQRDKNSEAHNYVNNKLPSEVRLWIIHSAIIYNYLLGIYEKNTEKYKETLSKEKIEILSIVLAFFDSTSKQKEILKKHGLSNEDILKKFNLPVNYLDFPKIENSDNTLANVFLKYCKDIKETTKFIEALCQNEFFLEIFRIMGINTDVIKVELKTGKNYEDTLTVEQRVEYLKALPVHISATSSVMDIITCDKNLGLHAVYIQDEYPKLMQSNELETATKKILELTKGVYIEEEVAVKPKGILNSLFGTTPEVKKEVKIDRSAIEALKPNIEAQIQVLYDEASKLSGLKSYVEAYFYKNRELIKNLSACLDKHKADLDATDKNDLFGISNLQSYITVLENKLNTLRLTDSLLLQEHFKLNQAIVNHCTTINSLFLSRDTLLPLIGTELAIGESIASENTSIEITKNIVNLLNDLILKDVAGINEVLDKLKSTNMSEEQLLMLSASVSTQLEQIAVANKLGSNISATPTIAPRDTTYDGLGVNNPYKRVLEP